jgi:hypothetical protein
MGIIRNMISSWWPDVITCGYRVASVLGTFVVAELYWKCLCAVDCSAVNTSSQARITRCAVGTSRTMWAVRRDRAMSNCFVWPLEDAVHGRHFKSHDDEETMHDRLAEQTEDVSLPRNPGLRVTLQEARAVLRTEVEGQCNCTVSFLSWIHLYNFSGFRLSDLRTWECKWKKFPRVIVDNSKEYVMLICILIAANRMLPNAGLLEVSTELQNVPPTLHFCSSAWRYTA